MYSIIKRTDFHHLRKPSLLACEKNNNLSCMNKFTSCFFIYQGLSSSKLVWAFHSETQEELLAMVPGMIRGEPSWNDLRQYGVGWWIKSNETLRRLIEKVCSLKLVFCTKRLFFSHVISSASKQCQQRKIVSYENIVRKTGITCSK